MAFSMNKKIAGMSVGAIVILAVVAFVVYWFAFRTEGFSTMATVSFEVKNNGPGVITAQIYGNNNGQNASGNQVTIQPGRTKRVNGKYNASDILPFTLYVKSSILNKYNVKIFGAKIRRLSPANYNTLMSDNGPLNQYMAWQNSRNNMPENLRLPAPIYNLGDPSGVPYLKEGSDYVEFVSTGPFSDYESGRRLFIENI